MLNGIFPCNRDFSQGNIKCQRIPKHLSFKRQISAISFQADSDRMNQKIKEINMENDIDNSYYCGQYKEDNIFDDVLYLICH